jgi:hypothetical protein
MNKFFKSPALLLCFVIFYSSFSSAFYSVQDNGELLKPEEMQFLTEVQIITQRASGVNLVGRIDRGLNEESSARLTVGAGETDFHIGASYKWVPYPDLATQPAIGFIFGAIYARYEEENELSLRATALVSKAYESDIGPFTPFIALPIGIRNYAEETDFPINLAVGTRYSHPDFETCEFTAELGLNLNESFGYVSVGAVFPAFGLE